jgi:hypothetical protein
LSRAIGKSNGSLVRREQPVEYIAADDRSAFSQEKERRCNDAGASLTPRHEAFQGIDWRYRGQQGADRRTGINHDLR